MSTNINFDENREVDVEEVKTTMEDLKKMVIESFNINENESSIGSENSEEIKIEKEIIDSMIALNNIKSLQKYANSKDLRSIFKYCIKIEGEIVSQIAMERLELERNKRQTHILGYFNKV